MAARPWSSASAAISCPSSVAAASTMALLCAGMSMAVFLLAKMLNCRAALSRSCFTARSRSSRKPRSRRAEDVLTCSTSRSSSSTYACAKAAARRGSWSMTVTAMIPLLWSSLMCVHSKHRARVFHFCGVVQALQVELRDQAVLHRAAFENAHKQRAGILNTQQIAGSASKPSRAASERGKHGHSGTRLSFRRHQLRGGFIPRGNEQRDAQASQAAEQHGYKQQFARLPEESDPRDQSLLCGLRLVGVQAAIHFRLYRTHAVRLPLLVSFLERIFRSSCALKEWPRRQPALRLARFVRWPPGSSKRCFPRSFFPERRWCRRDQPSTTALRSTTLRRCRC